MDLISWIPAGLWAALLFFLSAQSSLPGETLFPFGDKVAHFCMFAVLGVTLAWGGRNWRRRRALGALVLIGVAFAATDEWHQAFVPARDPSYGDFVADVLGVLLGFIAARLFLETKRCAPAALR